MSSQAVARAARLHILIISNKLNREIPMRRSITGAIVCLFSVGSMFIGVAGADDADQENSNGTFADRCAGLPSHDQLKSALTAARMQSNGGFNLDMWGAVVNRDGVVCAVAFTGSDRGSQWPGCGSEGQYRQCFQLAGTCPIDR
jgi:hypothetical protein